MARRKVILAEGQIYHIFNRGVEKRETFLDKRDYLRFFKTSEYYQMANPEVRFSFRKRPKVGKQTIPKKTQKSVDIYAYCLMPNHFHFLLKQNIQNGISTFISRLTNSYTRYFNIRYKRIGHLFQGSFKAVRIIGNEQLLHVARYIHLNPLIDYLVKDLKEFNFSSYPEYVGLKKGISSPDEILGQFQSISDYEKFVLDQEDYARELKSIQRLLLEDH
ncbi:MAG TPA: transposase [Candidatus Bathyarchaeia archaeon]|nr:transposase [Candidatus Bathyarchaeia archaeon]